VCGAHLGPRAVSRVRWFVCPLPTPQTRYPRPPPPPPSPPASQLFDVATPTQREVVVAAVENAATTLRRYTYGKHILARLTSKKPGPDRGPDRVPRDDRRDMGPPGVRHHQH
jgi:hypothetical protein